MKVKKIVSVCLVICLFLLTGCGKEERLKPGDPCIYYVNTADTRLERRAYEFAGDSVEEKIENVLLKMQEETDTIEYISPFPANLKIEKWEIDHAVLNLYFGMEYEEMDSAKELLFRAAIVQTLVQIKGVDYVCIFVNGEPLLDHNGIETGYMNEDDFVRNVGSSLHSYQDGQLRLYFANGKGDKLVTEDISVRYNSNTSKEKLIVERLLKGPGKDEAHPVIPTQTEILGVSTKDGICYVNFSSQFLNTEYKIDPHLTIYALVNSIVENGEAGQVQILVNGETDVTYQGSIDLSKPFSADSSYVEEK